MKIVEAENNIPDHAKHITTLEFNNLTGNWRKCCCKIKRS